MRLGMPLWAAALSLVAVAPAMAQTEEKRTSMLEMFFLSGDALGISIIWFILLMSAGSIGLMIQYFMRFTRKNLLPEETRAELEELLAAKKYREAIEAADNDPSYLGKLLSAALSEATNGYSAMERAIEEEGDAETTKILRPIEYLNLLGNIAPMMGLFGTVYGMIVAFQQLVDAGGRPDPAALAAGISTALVTTFWGLVVAMPALASYSLLRNKIDALTAEGLLIAEDVIRPFKPGGKKPATASAGAPAAAAPARADRPRATPKPE
jgi:biopolymer transport protein ExbB